MLTRKSILTVTTAAALCAAPILAFGQSSAQEQGSQPATGGVQAQGQPPTPGSPPPAGPTRDQPGTGVGRALDRARDSVTGGDQPDGAPGNPPGTAAGRAMDRALGTNTTGANPQEGASGPAATGATTPNMEVDSVRLREGRRATQIIGSAVYNENNESIGEVDDLIISREGGQPTAIISVGGFLGIGSRLVAVPLERLSWNAERERWSLPGASKDTLGGLPAFNYAGDRRG